MPITLVSIKIERTMNIKDEIFRMANQSFKEGHDYYSITLFSPDGKNIQYTIISGWSGFTEELPKRELRKARFVYPEKVRELLINMGEPPLVVNSDHDRQLYLLFGGHCIIESEITERFFPEFVEPFPVVQSLDPELGICGYHGIDTVAKQKLKKAPNPKLRMEILKRDGYKCKICGRSPDNYTDIELHVHHIRPFSKLGLTEKENLITLCHTCHKGLYPHFETSLFELIGQNGIFGYPNKNNLKNEYRQQVRNYQKAIGKNSLFK